MGSQKKPKKPLSESISSEGDVPPTDPVSDYPDLKPAPALFEIGDYIRVQDDEGQIIDSGYLISITGNKCEYYSSLRHGIAYTHLDALTQKPTVGDRVIHLEKNGMVDDVGYLVDTQKFMYTFYSAKTQSINTGIASEFETVEAPPGACEGELVRKALVIHHQIQELKLELERLQKEYEERRNALRYNMYEVFESAFESGATEECQSSGQKPLFMMLAECFENAGAVSQISVKLPGYIRLTGSFDLSFNEAEKEPLNAVIRFTTTHYYIVLPEQSKDYIQDLDLIIRIRNAHDQIVDDGFAVELSRIFGRHKLPEPQIAPKQESGVSVDPLFNATHPTVSNSYTLKLPINPLIVRDIAVQMALVINKKREPQIDSSQ